MIAVPRPCYHPLDGQGCQGPVLQNHNPRTGVHNRPIMQQPFLPKGLLGSSDHALITEAAEFNAKRATSHARLTKWLYDAAWIGMFASHGVIIGCMLPDRDDAARLATRNLRLTTMLCIATVSGLGFYGAGLYFKLATSDYEAEAELNRQLAQRVARVRVRPEDNAWTWEDINLQRDRITGIQTNRSRLHDAIDWCVSKLYKSQ